MDRYSGFSELQQNEHEGVDFAIIYRRTDSRVAIMAPHGGGIEPGTVDIADAVAGRDHQFYVFKGLKQKGNRVLHISSNLFDEPVGLKISQNAFIVISIHGCRDECEKVFVGGKNQRLKEEILSALRNYGFEADISERPGQRGICPTNICNRCISGEGVQLEIPRGLRERMFDNLRRRSLRKKTPIFYAFVDAIRSVLRQRA